MTPTFKPRGVILYPGQVQVVIPPLRVLIHTVMLTLRVCRLGALPSTARSETPQPDETPQSSLGMLNLW